MNCFQADVGTRVAHNYINQLRESAGGPTRFVLLQYLQSSLFGRKTFTN